MNFVQHGDKTRAALRISSVAFSFGGGVPMFLTRPLVMNECGVLHVEKRQMPS
jgi:hypothetical protein